MSRKLGKKRTRLDNKRAKDKDDDKDNKGSLAKNRDHDTKDEFSKKTGGSSKVKPASSGQKKEEKDEDKAVKKTGNKESFLDTVKGEQKSYHGDTSAKSAEKAISDYKKAEDYRKDPSKHHKQTHVPNQKSIYASEERAHNKPHEQHRKQKMDTNTAEVKGKQADQKSVIKEKQADKYLSAPNFPKAKSGRSEGSSEEGAEKTPEQTKTHYSSHQKDKGNDLGSSR